MCLGCFTAPRHFFRRDIMALEQLLIVLLVILVVLAIIYFAKRV